jgi:starch phosphorylase
MNSLYQRYLGADWVEDSIDEAVWSNMDKVPDEELWRTHQRNKERLVVFARNRLKAQMQRRGTYHTELNWAEEVLDPEALTIGFARRFATYKRGNLLLKDPQRFVRILSDTNRPVQIIFAGKAHPRDKEGKEIIRQIIHFANQYNVRRRIVFLEDYGIGVARVLMQGVDVWLNNPRRPMEASGTSGMKAAINGALNMSTLDGWWCEGYKPETGWVIGAGETYDDPAYQDMVESQAIYNLLENEVIPLFYTRSRDGLPRAWIRKMKNSIAYIAPLFSAHRMVAQYTQEFYNPSVTRWRCLTRASSAKAKELSAWKANLKAVWPNIAIRDVQVWVNNNGSEPTQFAPRQTQLKVGSHLTVKALVKLDSIQPDDISIELYHGCVNAWGDINEGTAVRMDHVESNGTDGEHWFTGDMSCEYSGRQGLTVRVMPKHDDLLSSYEPGLILWETADTKNPLTAG